MPRCGAHSMKNVPLGQGGRLQGGLNAGTNPSQRCATAVAGTKGIFTSFPPSEARAGIQSSKEPRSGWRGCRFSLSPPPDFYGGRPGSVQKLMGLFASWNWPEFCNGQVKKKSAEG